MSDNYKPLDDEGRSFVPEEELATASRIAITNLKAETTEAVVMKKTTQRSPEFHGAANCHVSKNVKINISLMVESAMNSHIESVIKLIVDADTRAMEEKNRAIWGL